MNTTVSRAALALAVLLLSGAAGHAAALIASNGMTLYVFDKDKGGKSSCTGFCADFWPPYVAQAGQKQKKGWSEIKRADGRLQWAFHGRPLYFYAYDKKKGDRKGDGKDGVWHVAH